jgi:hypothetical protein
VTTKTSEELINTDKDFLAPLSRKVASIGSVDKLILIDVIEITIDLCSNRLTLVLSTCVSYVG